MALSYYLKSFKKVRHMGDLGGMAQESKKIRVFLYTFVERGH